MAESALSEAQAWGRLGIPTFPTWGIERPERMVRGVLKPAVCGCGDWACTAQGKHGPIDDRFELTGGFNGSTINAELHRARYAVYRDCGVAVRCGASPDEETGGVVVLDGDDDGSINGRDRLFAEHGWFDSWVERTGRGFHMILSTPPGVVLENRPSKRRWYGMEVKAHDCLVVVSPSPNKLGVNLRYLKRSGERPPMLPDDLVEALTEVEHEVELPEWDGVRHPYEPGSPEEHEVAKGLIHLFDKALAAVVHERHAPLNNACFGAGAFIRWGWLSDAEAVEAEVIKTIDRVGGQRSKYLKAFREGRDTTKGDTWIRKWQELTTWQ